jgi:hypothetical protein
MLKADEVKEYEMGRTCNVHGRDDNVYKSLVRKPERREVSSKYKFSV